MLYIGNLHVIEAQGLKFSKQWKIGVRAMPLTIYSQKYDLLVLRHDKFNFSDIERKEIARYALNIYAYGVRRYNYGQVISLGKEYLSQQYDLKKQILLDRRYLGKIAKLMVPSIEFVAKVAYFPIQKLPKLFKKNKKGNAVLKATCSEFALECYALGGAIFPPIYAKYNSEEMPILPATLFGLPNTQKFRMSYYKFFESGDST